MSLSTILRKGSPSGIHQGQDGETMSSNHYSELSGPEPWAADLLQPNQLRDEAGVLATFGITATPSQRYRWRSRRTGPRMPAVWSKFRWWTTADAIREWLCRCPGIAKDLGVPSDES